MRDGVRAYIALESLAVLPSVSHSLRPTPTRPSFSTLQNALIPDPYFKNRLSTFAAMRDTASSTRIELGQVIEPTENTCPPEGVS